MSEVKGLRELAQQLAWSRMLSQTIDRAIIRLIGRTCFTLSARGVRIQGVSILKAVQTRRCVMNAWRGEVVAATPEVVARPRVAK